MGGGIRKGETSHQEFRIILGYMVSSRLVWATLYLVSKKPEKKKKKPYTLIYKSIVTGMNLIPKCQGMGKCSQLLKIVFI